MIDTHAHLAERFQQEVDLSELTWVILSASSEKDSLDNLQLAKTNPKLRPAVGIHPDEIGEDIDGQINFLGQLLNENKQIVAVGECGIDLADNKDFRRQEILFRGQICLAVKFQKPLIVHSREASEEVLRILGDYGDIKGVIHCYTGGKKRIKKFLNLPGEWFFGIDGNLTYESGLEQVVREIPPDRLVLETDTPFLTPVPHRGETNQPAYIKYIYEKVAEIWEKSKEETEAVIDANATRLFNLESH